MISAQAMLNREQSRLIDKIAIEEYGIPGIVLMENAARGASEIIAGILDRRRKSKKIGNHVAIICGGGNNGGDGYAIARHLSIRGVKVEIFAVNDPAKLNGDAAINHHIAERMGLKIHDVLDSKQLAFAARKWSRANVIVDAILGTGFSGELRPHLASVIAKLNQVSRKHAIKVVAADLPSGMDCDTGEASGVAVHADVTVTFVAPKIGFANPASKKFTGAVKVAGIGAPKVILERVMKINTFS